MKIGSTVTLKRDFQTETILVPKDTELEIVGVVSQTDVLAKTGSGFVIKSDISNLNSCSNSTTYK